LDTNWQERLEALLETVSRPARYVGGEVNQADKEWKPGMTRFCFAFPDTYEVAMSHLGMKVIYDAVNRAEGLVCERVMMPWTDMLEGMKKEGVPLFSLETRTPLSAFDAVGFTLQYEMSYTNVLAMLDAGGIAVESRDRGRDAPVVIAGGPCAFNPEPLADFVDAFLMGDGETATLEMLRVIGDGRRRGLGREDILLALAQIEGVYVPRFYTPEYHGDGRLASFSPVRAGVPARVRKRIEPDLDLAAYPETVPLPFTEAVHDRIVLEIMRGCTRGCRFCQAGMLYRPVRERSPEKLFALAEKLVASTGYEEMSLSSLSTGDYSRLPALIQGLDERFSSRRVALSLPSLRVDGELKQTLEMSSQVKKSGLTLAPEAGTQRLRDVINKGVTEEDVLRSVTEAFESGWSGVKLYFMIGLPTETDEDLLGIAELAKKVVGRYYALPREKRPRGLKVVVSASTFVPKPFTPFQWAPQDGLPEIKRKQALLRQALNIRGVEFNWHEPELSVLEACFARGDRRLGRALLAAWRSGCVLDGWSEQFDNRKWLDAFEVAGLTPAFYAQRERTEDELLPWDFADIGVTRAYLRLELRRALEGQTTPDCRDGCEGCGLRRFEGICPE